MGFVHPKAPLSSFPVRIWNLGRLSRGKEFLSSEKVGLGASHSFQA
ncbi:hypothetical protein LEP1GSC195_0450 [Leptospira wolbachii serovar Codice str. CDC]|uniref:Uncharacterized protein n=1 Tax=Leptospira wolbachii serovar Codice str. CDC TaxID=1218599 RepID=R9A8K3_9LEPT|nr:hypothetical protein LEP1GSC195_0450 [Leptospira wolbachii serovar Codice str. CDC]